MILYSVLFGPYDVPLESKFGGILFTDQDIRPRGWGVRRVEPPHPDPRYASRYYWQSHKVLPAHQYSLVHGANAQLQMSPEKVVGLLPENIDIGVFRHPHRDNVYDEAEACIRMRKDKREIIEAQMARYREEGFPGDELSACIFMVRRNTPDVVEFEAFWWNEIATGSHRDQLSFDYTRWRLGVPIMYLNDLGIGMKRVINVTRHKKPGGVH